MDFSPFRLVSTLAASALVGAAAMPSSAALNNGSIQLHKIGGFDHGPATAAEIVSYDPASKRLFVVNGALGTVDILDISNPSSPSLVNSLSGAAIYGAPVGTTTGVNSVSVHNGIIALAIDNKNTATNAQNPGKVAFVSAAGSVLKVVDVGYLPDMLTFTPDGKKVLVANEGEPNSYGAPTSFDPEGSVSIIDLNSGVANATVTNVGFTAFNGQQVALNAQGIRIYGPGATVAQDLEPEYIAVSPDGTKAYVSLQEANGFATIDIATGTVDSIKSFGLKDHSLPGNRLDGSDRDGPGTGGSSLPLFNLANWPVKGMYMPDGIAAFEVGGQTYIITANEGDARDYTGFSEETTVGNAGYVLDPGVFPNAAALKNEDAIGRLTVTRASGNLDGDSEFEQIHAFGARSFSIFKPDGTLVFDSGDQFEAITRDALGNFFNISNDNQNFDNRSDNKGPEPESVAIGEYDGRLLAFIGLERIGGVMIYDITDPLNPLFVNYANSREFTFPFNAQTSGDLGPEGLIYISAANSPIGVPLVITANEVSGTTAIFQVTGTPEPSSVMLLGSGLIAAGLRRRGTR